MKKFCLSIAIFTILLADSAFIKAQTDSIPLAQIVETRNKQIHDLPVEKVHLHFDKPYYGVGDTIWFKAYVTMDVHTPSPLSKILYIDFINPKDSLLQTLRLPVTQSVATGSIPLPYEKISQGNYRIRAYTLWMMNSSPDYFFRKNITIGNAISKDLITYISFSEESGSKEKTIKALIQYKNEKGVPLVNKKVNWEITADYERYQKGKATTDENGFIRISFPDSRKVSLATGKLTTSLEDENQRILQADFSLKKAIIENDIQFFPESGELIAGLPSKVAFKAIKSDGLGSEVKGEILDGNGNQITTFESQHLGMGYFFINATEDIKYTAKVTFQNGETKTFALPSAKTSGMSMAVGQSDENINLRIYANEKYFEEHKGMGFYIVAQSNGFTFYAAQSNLSNQVFNVAIPKGKFPSGIVQLTLLKASGDPICERLTFIKGPDLLTIKATPELSSYKSRQKVKINLQTSSADSAVGNYSVSVISAEKIPFKDENETTILSNLLLTSDLTGFIEQPNYYFFEEDKIKNEHLDMLMLTQGFRRFSFKDNQPKQFTYLPEQGIKISGTIRRSNGFPLEKGRLLLQIPDKHFSLSQTTDNEGKFSFDHLVFKDSSEVIINAKNNLNSKDLRIMVDGEPYPHIFPNINAPVETQNIDSTLTTFLKNNKTEHNNTLVLKEVVIKGAAEKKPSHLDYSSLTGLNMMADKTLQGDMLGSCPIIANCLTGAGLTYIDEQLILTRNYQQGLTVPVEIYVNDMPVDANYLMSLDAKGIESVEVFNTDGVSGINRRSNTSGVVVFNLKEVKKTTLSKEQFKALFPETNVLKYQPKGYATERHFYVPKYSGPRTALQPLDVRSTIYWNPIVNTDADGKASFEFYNNDLTGKYKVVVEGINNNGRIGRSVSYYEVK